jgi:type II secretory pathway pseudopilin PulG
MGGWSERARQVEQRGYTLIELVVVVGIIIVMTIVGMPFFTVMMRNSQLDAAARQLAGDVRDARSLATKTGWQYRILGGNAGGTASYKSQYRLMGRSSPAVAWPADTSPNLNFPTPPAGATQMAGPWINFTQVYPNVSLNPSVTNPSFYVSFNSQGVAFEWNPTAGSWMTITPSSGSSTPRQLTITAAGGIKIQ